MNSLNSGSVGKINASVTDKSGKGVANALVTFTTDGTYGTFSPASGTVLTDASGVASILMNSGNTPGASTISATAIWRDAAEEVTATGGVNFSVSAAVGAVIGLNAAPSSVRPGGTSTLTIALLDANGNPVSGESVTLSFDVRNSGTPRLSEFNGTTDINGLLSVTYTAGANNGDDIVKARTSAGVVNSTAINVNQSNIVIGSVETTASNSSIPVNTGASVIRALVKDSADQIVSGAMVNFKTSAGTFGAAGSSVLTTTSVTDASGYALATLRAGSQVLTARVEATISGFTGTANVSFAAGTPNAINVSAAPRDVGPGINSTIFAYVVDSSLNPVAGETVTFSVPGKGSGLPTLNAGTAVTNANGLASVTYTAGASNGSDTVSAVTSNGKTGSVGITVSSSVTVVGRVTLLTGGASLPADGTSEMTLRATVLSTTNNPASGVSVKFTTTGGSLSAPTATTNASGIAEVRLRSPIRTGTVTVIADASGFLASQEVTIVASQPVNTKFALSANPAVVNAGGSSALTAIVRDAYDNPVAGQTVTFSITTNPTNGSIAPVTATTSANGIATVIYTGGSTLGTDTIRAALVSGLAATTNVTVSGGELDALTIGTSRTTVKSDNSQTAIITVTALSSKNVVVPGVTINFASDGGQLSASQVVTNLSGQASVNLQPGTLDKSNRVITVTATATGVSPAVFVPVRVVDSTVALTASATSLTAGGAGATVTVTARDASGLGIYNTPVILSQTGTGSLDIVPTTGNTDVNGQFTATVTGLTAGTRTLTATALGATASQDFNILASSAFGITAPAIDPTAMTTGGTLAFTVNAPTQTQVRFATTIGTWSVCPGGVPGSNVCTATAAGTATATLTSTIAGIAGIQVDGLNAGNVTGTDLHTVAITSAVATSISLQASATNVQPSTGGVSNTVTLIATLRDASGRPVGNAPVAFSLLNTTGGGETLSPIVTLSSNGVTTTDPLGQARTTFTSGSLPSGQTSSSVRIQASVIGSAPEVKAEVNLVIGGTAGSVVIGQASHFTDSYNQTAYTTPMTVQVADSNGNPVPGGTVVSLSVWPTDYSLGTWVGTDKCVPVRIDPLPSVDSDLDGSSTNDFIYPNEDANENLVLDTGEDKAPKLDGSLTPANSTAGTLPSSIVTDANGLASFNLIYLKQYAAWIGVRVRATALVQGTEATGNLFFTLPWLKADSDACVLPHSPFN
jgi:hypothetical protein